ncbi:MAG: NUDIX domain-containing protein [Paraburkholderia graminis]|uniref:NUDIX domain-containing protein n=1 Tax=Paraburkholderia graminis TaxID=60548 RepID=UPI00389A3AD7
MLVLRDGNAVMLEKRPPSGIWGGLWSLPEAADEALLEARAREFGGERTAQAVGLAAHAQCGAEVH